MGKFYRHVHRRHFAFAVSAWEQFKRASLQDHRFAPVCSLNTASPLEFTIPHFWHLPQGVFSSKNVCWFWKEKNSK